MFGNNEQGNSTVEHFIRLRVRCLMIILFAQAFGWDLSPLLVGSS